MREGPGGPVVGEGWEVRKDRATGAGVSAKLFRPEVVPRRPPEGVRYRVLRKDRSPVLRADPYTVL